MSDTYSSPRKSKASRNLTDMLNGGPGVPQAAHQYLPPLPETPKGPSTAKKSGALSRFLSRYDLPPNDALSSLPPLPDTPRQPVFERTTSLRRVDSTAGSTPRLDRAERVERTSQHVKLNDASRSTPPPAGYRTAPRSKTYAGLSKAAQSDSLSPSQGADGSPRFPSQPAYPTLSSRQSGRLNTARTPSGSSASPFAGIPAAARSSSSPSTASPRAELEDSHSSIQPYISKRADRAAAFTNTLLGPPSPSMYASMRLPPGLADASLLQDATFGMLGGRDSFGSQEDISWEYAPNLLPLSTKWTSPVQIASSAGVTSPSAASPTSRAGQTTSPTRSSPRKGSPAKRRGGFTPAQALGESIMMPTPSKNAHLLESVNALNRIDPPWMAAGGGDNSLNTSFLDKTQAFSAAPMVKREGTSKEQARLDKENAGLARLGAPAVETSTNCLYPAASTSGSPLKASILGGFLAPPMAMSRRQRVPSSPFAQSSSLARTDSSIAEEPNETGDVSTVLPISPLKHRHLLSDDNNLLAERLDMSSMFDIDGPSMFMPPPAASRPHDQKTRQEGSRSPTKAGQATAASQDPYGPISPKKRGASSPSKPHQSSTAAQMRYVSPVRLKVDQTMDLKDMMAAFRKPKRPSGGEETFMDLMNASMDEMDGQMLADETFFLPLDLRPAHPSLVRSKSLSRIETEKRIAKVRASIAARDVMLTSPDKASASSGLGSTSAGSARSRTLERGGEALVEEEEEPRGRRRESGERGKRVSLSAGPRMVHREPMRPNLASAAAANMVERKLGGNGFALPSVSRISDKPSAKPTAAASAVARSIRPASQTTMGPTRRVPSTSSSAAGAVAAARTSKSSAPPSAVTRTARPPGTATGTTQPSAPRTRVGSTASGVNATGRATAGTAPTSRAGSTASIGTARSSRTSAGPVPTTAPARGIARSATTGGLSSTTSSRAPAGARPGAIAGVSSAVSARSAGTASSGAAAMSRPRPIPSTASTATTGRPPATRTFGSVASGIVNRAPVAAPRDGVKAIKTSMAPPPVPTTGSKRSVPPPQTAGRSTTTTEHVVGRNTSASAIGVSSINGSAPTSRARSTPAAVVAQASRALAPSKPVAGTMRAPTSSSSAAGRPGIPFRSATDAMTADMPVSFRTAPTAGATGHGVAPRARVAGSSTGIRDVAGRAAGGFSGVRGPKLASGTGSVSRAEPGGAAAKLADLRARLDRMQARQG